MHKRSIDWDSRDTQEIAADIVESAATQPLDVLDGDRLEDVLGVAVELRDAAQAIIAGQLQVRR